ncbi:DUF222 domain-containing protein [Amycolatopsis sp. CA-230715]|uniref:DUF222 domain-containing protein n=1 Tax=Amycolatopsis sp. CA-230715 TaxID=2745196 RepID=UPI001C0100B2|nr:DUF222 domain-containing protein [Amycolatopsis sp. CA-230715]QWF79961.1 hypothetical protein HUW46_03374 [Amycolatopsis sp. CA-230715]
MTESGVDREDTDLAEALRRSVIETNQAHARMLRLIAEFVETEQERGTPIEVARLLDITEREANRKIALAQALLSYLPKTLTALDNGEISEEKAMAVFSATRCLSEPKAQEVDDVIVTKFPGRNPSTLRRAANVAVTKVDAEAHAKRSRKARSDSMMRVSHGANGTSTLRVRLPAEEAMALYSTCDRVAQDLKAQGDTRPVAQLRAQTLVTRCLDGENRDGVVKADVLVHIDQSTLEGERDDPAHLVGYGPISAAVGREISASPHATQRTTAEPRPSTERVLHRTPPASPHLAGRSARIRLRPPVPSQRNRSSCGAPGASAAESPAPTLTDSVAEEQ